MNYYIASEQGPLGPYTEEQLIARRLKGHEMVWREGLTEWTAADQLPELDDVLKSASMPPRFNREKFDSQLSTTPLTHPMDNAPSQYGPRQALEQCPPNYRWLAIIAFAGIIPCAIVAIIKSVMVTRLWEEGNYDGSRRQSRSALTWGLISLIIGVPLNIYYMFFMETPVYSDLLEQLL